MTYGETLTGFRAKTFAEAQAEIRQKLRARISSQLTLDEKDWLGNVVDIYADREALLWEAIEVARNQFDPDNAEGQPAIGLAALTGTKRRQPTKGIVLCTLGLDASKTFAPGALVGSVEGQPTNRWVNRDQVVSTTAGSYAGIPFIAETAGRFFAPVGQLNVIAQTASGWNSITNPADASPGLELESIPDLMVRREEELGGAGNGTVAAIHNAVSDVEGVLDVRVFYNDTGSTAVIAGVSMPANSYRVVVWDGGTATANVNDIAQAYFDAKSGAAPAISGGVNPTSGTVTDIYGTVKSIPFAWVFSVPYGCAITVQAPTGTNVSQLTEDIKESIVALWPTKIGTPIYVSKLMAGPAAQAAVLNIVSMGIGIGAGPYPNQSATPPLDQFYRVSAADINVTVNLV